jgi:hypothetical protein
MGWSRPHLYIAEPLEYRTRRILDTLAEPEPGTDLRLPTDRGDDHEPARAVTPLRSVPDAPAPPGRRSHRAGPRPTQRAARPGNGSAA